MSSEKSLSQKINISGSQLSGAQIGGQAGRDLSVTAEQRSGNHVDGESLTSSEVISLLERSQQLLVEANLSTTELQAENPDKEVAAKSLQRVTKVLKETDATIAAGTGLWQKIKPMLEAISPWLGVAKSFLI